MSQNSLFEDTQLSPLNLPGAEVQLWKQWLDQELALQLFDTLLDSLEWQQPDITIAGRQIKIPRLQAWHGDPNSRYAYSGKIFSPQPWTPELEHLKDQLKRDCKLSFNSVLVNLYRDGQDSVSWHADDESELGPEPNIASVSLGATRRFSLRPSSHHPQAKALGKTQNIDLSNGDLLLMAGQTQRNWLHQIPKTKNVSGARINLTFRMVKAPRAG